MKLDSTDRAILSALQKDAGLSNKELARKIRLAPSSCLQRVRRLWTDGALLGLHADVSPDALGIGLQALLAVRFTHHLEKDVESFRHQLRARPEVVSSRSLSCGARPRPSARCSCSTRAGGSIGLKNPRMARRAPPT